MTDTDDDEIPENPEDHDEYDPVEDDPTEDE
jgi:hypothetical protein